MGPASKKSARPKQAKTKAMRSDTTLDESTASGGHTSSTANHEMRKEANDLVLPQRGETHQVKQEFSVKQEPNPSVKTETKQKAKPNKKEAKPDTDASGSSDDFMTRTRAMRTQAMTRPQLVGPLTKWIFSRESKGWNDPFKNGVALDHNDHMSAATYEKWLEGIIAGAGSPTIKVSGITKAAVVTKDNEESCVPLKHVDPDIAAAAEACYDPIHSSWKGSKRKGLVGRVCGRKREKRGRRGKSP
ncbi:hypothetical protein V8E36_008579 [Tilletia maclaganii]